MTQKFDESYDADESDSGDRIIDFLAVWHWFLIRMTAEEPASDFDDSMRLSLEFPVVFSGMEEVSSPSQWKTTTAGRRTATGLRGDHPCQATAVLDQRVFTDAVWSTST